VASARKVPGPAPRLSHFLCDVSASLGLILGKPVAAPFAIHKAVHHYLATQRRHVLVRLTEDLIHLALGVAARRFKALEKFAEHDDTLLSLCWNALEPVTLEEVSKHTPNVIVDLDARLRELLTGDGGENFTVQAVHAFLSLPHLAQESNSPEPLDVMGNRRLGDFQRLGELTPVTGPLGYQVENPKSCFVSESLVCFQ